MRIDVERLAVLQAIKKIVDNEIKEIRPDVESYLREMNESMGVTELSVDMGGNKAVLKQSMSKAAIKGYEDEEDFLEFMADHGMTVTVVSPSWTDHCAYVNGTVVWQETGEPVPHAYWEPSHPKAMTVTVRDAPAFVRAALDSGSNIAGLLEV